LRILLIVCCLFLATGCAKTVTPTTTYGTEAVVEITLRGNADVINNRYFMVLSNSQSFSVPLTYADNTEYEFLSVGDPPQSGSQESYYTKYYSTWNGYIELNNNGYYLTKGPFTYETTATPEPLSLFDGNTNTLKFDFRLDRIFGTSIPDTIYFDLITVSYPLSGSKRTQDLLYPDRLPIPKGSSAEKSGSDLSDTTLNSSLDITGWKVRIQ